MKSKIACALLLVAPFISDVSGQNVLKNPGFEEKGGWNYWGGVQDTAAHGGKFSLRIHNDDPKWSGTDQTIILPEGVQNVTISGWMRADSVRRGQKQWENARMAVEFYDAENKQVGGYPPPLAEASGNRAWRQYKRNYPVPPTAIFIKLQLALGNATGTAYYDDLEMTLNGTDGTTMQAGIFKAAPSKPEDNIRLNQLGYYPKGPKMAIVVAAATDKFYVLGTAKKDTVFRGKLVKKGTWKPSGEEVSQADFSTLTAPGSYILVVPDLASSYPFEIKNKVGHNMAKASLKTYYYQRTVIDLKPEYAGKWARKAGHPDTAVLIHASAVSPGRPEGTKISSPRGWYDAGDYNKYIVNSGISTYTLLALYEHFPKFMDTVRTNIPESKNALPDLLDEALFNVRWMITMQDPADGGVYHKLTNPNFDGELMPDKATEPRYVVMKSTAAALDFAAVMAQASRIFKKFSKQLPKFSDSCLAASQKAYDWAKKNPQVYYIQSEMNKKFKPPVITGEYGDQNVKDEFQWAAMELYATTGDKKYYADANIVPAISTFNIPAWQDVNTLGLITLASPGSVKAAAPDAKDINARLIKLGDDLKNHAASSEMATPMGIEMNNFTWGSNSFAANQGVILIQAYRLTKNKEYLNAAIAILDYLLGRNGTGYSYVSTFGTKFMKKPHHRPSQADGIKDPIPGFIAGGPNPGQEDKQACAIPYPSDLPAKSYLDEHCSYASNEVAINWNAPLTYLAFAIEAIMAEQGK